MVAPGSIVILDFGGQYAHLIANRVRRLGAFSEIRNAETSATELKGAAGIILSGGPQSVYDKESPQADVGIFTLGIPVLGLCYGHQWLAQALGGKVTPGKVKEYGRTQLTVNERVGLFADLPLKFNVWMSHGDEVSELPPGFAAVGSTENCAVAAMADVSRHLYGLQCHIEVTHTEYGMDMLKNFVSLCKPAPWSVGNFVEHVSAQVLKEVGDRKVFMLVSGGVDSTVAFTLLNKVLGPKRVQGLLVDTGLMRLGEVAMIQDAFAKLGVTNLRVEDASEEFFTALEGIVDPEHKRKIIGDTFLAVQRRVSEEMGLSPAAGWLLGQGTIYPDTIESKGTKHADHIKTHHNRVAAVQQMIEQGLVLEPLKELYKDEVRELGEKLGLPKELVWRHPFPGPGLGVRILCAQSAVRVNLSAEEAADRERQIGHLHYRDLPVRSVGVQGDGRTYRHAVALFSRHPCHLTGDQLQLATLIPNGIHCYNRVLVCTSHTADDMPEFHSTPGHITRERADLLREADAVVMQEIVAAGLMETIWQFPVVLLPMGTKAGKESIVLRPIHSTDAMTADAVVLPEPVLKQITARLLDLHHIDAVFVDLTSKPPGTIEWE